MIHITTGLSLSASQKSSVTTEEGEVSQTAQKSVSITQTQTHTTADKVTLGEPSTANSNATGVDAYKAVEAGESALNPHAKTIVSFIQAQLQRDVADGATQEELQTRLQAGLDGFLQGFGEAYNQLQDSGLLDAETRAAIQETRSQVLGEINKMAEELGLEKPVKEPIDSPDEATPTPGVHEGALDALSPQKEILNAVQNLQNQNLNILNSFTQTMDRMEDTYAHLGKAKRGVLGEGVKSASVAESKSFEFDLTTKDGDTVSIRFEAKEVDVYKRGANGDAAMAGHSTQSFSFDVTGEIDADELRAINELLSDVNNLSATFFEGDVNRAFEMALELGFDDEEIASFSLDLTKITMGRVEVGPKEVQPEKVKETFSPLNEYANEVQKLAEKAEHMGFERRLIADLTKAFEAAREHLLTGDKPDRGFRDHPERLTDFTQHILNSTAK